MSLTKQVLLSLAVLILIGGGWFAYENRAQFFGGETAQPVAGTPPALGPAGQGAVPVVAGPVEIDSTGDELTAIGTLTAAREVDIYAQVTGIVTDVGFTPGGEVTSGQVLIQLDDGDQQVALDRAKIALDDANAAVARSEKLAKSNNITAVALSDATTAAGKAKIDLRSAELDLAKRTINAPFAGTIGLTDISVGDLVTPSKPIATIDDTSALSVEFDTPERFAGRVGVGDAVKVSADALPGKSFGGKIVAADNRITQASRTLKLKASVSNESGVLKPGMAVAVDLSLPGEPNPSVPSLAIQWDRRGSFVWKLNGDTVTRVGVTILDRHGRSVVVLSDLSDKDQVIVEGVQSLREGIRVARVDQEANIVASDPPAAAAAPATAAGDQGKGS
jgi:RND family efflux transporter MFP subunit